jgi:hypothetical protein
MHKYFFINKSCYICLINFKQNSNMKKIILSVVAVMAFGFANAQDKDGAGLAKGDLVLTGAFNYQSVSQGDAKESGLIVAPGIGYMIADNWMLSGAVAIGSATANSGAEGEEDTKATSFGFGAGVSYFWTPAERFSVSLGGALSYGTATFKDAVETADGFEDLKVNTIGLNVPVGLHYFVSDNFAITTTWGGLGYSSEKEDTEGAEAQNGLSLGLNMSSISFGLLYKL